MQYYKRSLEIRIKDALSLMPAVFLIGPRQAGKSTLVRHIAGTYLDADYVTFDDISTLAAAANDPEGFLRQFAKPVIIDEVQMVPEVFRVLKLIVDERRAQDKSQAAGRFLLTGSTNILALPGLADALVGRMAVLSLYPLAAVESLGNGRPVLNGWFDQDISFKNEIAGIDKKPAFNDIIRRATFPEISAGSASNTALWFESYLTTLLQRDVRQLAEIEKIPALPNMIKILAARAGSLLNDAACARDAKLNAVTYRRYRVLLEQLFLIALVPPWYRNIGKRLVKSPKLFFIDTALLCHELGVDVANLSGQNPGLFGHVLENFVASELAKQLAMLADGGTLYHFRTHDEKEVDFVIERRNGQLLGIEVKGRESVTPGDFAGLQTLKEQAGADFRRGIVLYLGKTTTSFGNDMVAMPLESLWRFNMNVMADKALEYSFASGSYLFWATYGDSTRIRCEIPQTVIDDHFHDNASESQSREAVKNHWNLIWSIFERKIMDGQITTSIHDHVDSGRKQKISFVQLQSGDLGRQDFRQR